LNKPWHVLLLVHKKTEPIPYSASFQLPAEMLEVAVRETHGYSSAAMVPEGVPGTAGVAEAATVVQEESEKKVRELGLRLEEEQVAM
jgi:hypothetical protein